MATNKGMFGDRLAEAQYAWLKSTIGVWYNNKSVLFANNTFNTVFVDIYDAATGYWEMDQMNAAGEVTHSRTNDPSNYRATVWNGTPGNYIYLFGENGHVDISSYETLGFGVLPTTRVDYNLTRIMDTDWTWLNLYYVLNALNNIHAITALEAEEKRQLAYEWDSQMAYKTVSPYFCDWVGGALDETEMATFFDTAFRDKWNGLYDALQQEYDPLSNYKMHEEEHIDEVKDEDTTTSDTSESAGTNSNTQSSSSTTNDDVYAFNSSTESPDSKNTSSDTSTDSGSTTNSSSSSGTNNFAADNDTDRERDAVGNTGVYSYQKMIQDEWELRQKLVLEEIRKDITEMLTLPIYI